MRNEPPAPAKTAQRAELDALRRRAYSAAPDIARDPAALARLVELEERERLERLARLTAPIEREPAVIEREPAPTAEQPRTADRSSNGSPSTPRAPRSPRATAIGAGAAGLVLILGGSAWSAIHTAATAPSDAVAIPVVADERWSMSSESGYDLYLDRLRDGLLATAGLEDFAARAVHDSLRPYGAVYGRKVWTGSTIDGEHCMVVSDSPAPVVACAPAEPASASVRSISLAVIGPRDAVDSAAEITYTLLADGRVIAAPTATP